jgi:hypothetical protein
LPKKIHEHLYKIVLPIPLQVIDIIVQVQQSCYAPDVAITQQTSSTMGEIMLNIKLLYLYVGIEGAITEYTA